MYPNIEIVFTDIPDMAGPEFQTWLSTQILAGTAPDLVRSDNSLIAKGWALPIGEYLDQPNPFIDGNKRWRDAFFPKFMETLRYIDGQDYSAPIRAIYPAMVIGLVYNKDYFRENDIPVPTNWAELKEVSKLLKDTGTGLSPWPRDAHLGNVWPLPMQILPPLLQGLGPEMDLNGDAVIDIQEGLEAYEKGLVGVRTEIYETAINEALELNEYMIEGFSTSDMGAMFKQGELFLQYQGSWDFARFQNDPAIDFEVGFLPAFFPTPDDVPGAHAAMEMTPGGGEIPMEYIVASEGAGHVILKDSVEARGNLEEVLLWWQFLTTPENAGFLVNENQAGIPAVIGAPLGSLWQDIANFQLPMYEYSFTWEGMGLMWDMAYRTQWFELLVANTLGIISYDEMIDQWEDEWDDGADRFKTTQQ
jgi:ABC-type glycerol-3-phosphate transport system substrate-binding protein